MGYRGMFLDSKGRALAGDRSYVINVPANPPNTCEWNTVSQKRAFQQVHDLRTAF